MQPVDKVRVNKFETLCDWLLNLHELKVVHVISLKLHKMIYCILVLDIPVILGEKHAGIVMLHSCIYYLVEESYAVMYFRLFIFI